MTVERADRARFACGILTRFELLDSPLVGHQGWARALAFSPDGAILVSGGSDGTVIVWDMVTRQVLGEPLEAGIGEVNTVSFSPEGEILVAVNGKGVYRRWRVTTQHPIGEPSKLYQNPFISLFSGHDRQANRLPNFSFGDAAPLSQSLGGLIWAAHGRLLATTNKEGAIVLVNSHPSEFPVLGGSGIDFRDSYAGNRRARPSALSSDRKTIATIELSGKVALREIGATEPSVSWETNLGWPRQSYFTPRLAFSLDGKRLVVAGCGEFQRMEERPPHDRYWRPQCVRSQVGVWEIDSQEPVTEPFSDHEAAILAIAFVPDSNRLVSSGIDGSRVVRSLRTGKVSKQAPPEPNLKLGDYTISSDGKRVAAAERDRRPEQLRILLWNHGHRAADTPRIWRRLSPVTALALNPVNQTLALGGYGGRMDQSESGITAARLDAPSALHILSQKRHL